MFESTTTEAEVRARLWKRTERGRPRLRVPRRVAVIRRRNRDAKMPSSTADLERGKTARRRQSPFPFLVLWHLSCAPLYRSGGLRFFRRSQRHPGAISQPRGGLVRTMFRTSLYLQ